MKPYAWEITIRRHDGNMETITRVAPTEMQARRKGLLRPLAMEIVDMEPIDEETYHRAFGYARRWK